MSLKKHENKNKLGYFYTSMQALNGVLFVLIINFVIFAQFKTSEWLEIGILGIFILYCILLPVSIFNIIYYFYMLHKKFLTKKQKRVSITILVFSIIVVLFMSIDFGIIPI